MKLCVIGSYAKALVMTVDRIPLAGETLIGRDFRGTFGGKGSDMAVQAARLEAQVDFIGVIGADSYGQELQELLSREKINFDGMRIAENESTGIGFIIKDDSAKNVIVVDMGANKSFDLNDVDHAIEKIKQADVVLAQLEIPIDTALYALKKAKEFGKITVLNPAPAVSLTDYDLSFVDYLTPNETEGQVALGNIPDEKVLPEDTAKQLLEKTKCRQIVMTLGSDGALIATQDRMSRVPANKVEVVDSNGAGDCFNASFSVALGNGESLEAAVKFASAAAALCCTKWETVPSYHTLEEVQKFIKAKESYE